MSVLYLPPEFTDLLDRAHSEEFGEHADQVPRYSLLVDTAEDELERIAGEGKPDESNE